MPPVTLLLPVIEKVHEEPLIPIVPPLIAPADVKEPVIAKVVEEPDKPIVPPVTSCEPVIAKVILEPVISTEPVTYKLSITASKLPDTATVLSIETEPVTPIGSGTATSIEPVTATVFVIVVLSNVTLPVIADVPLSETDPLTDCVYEDPLKPMVPPVTSWEPVIEKVYEEPEIPIVPPEMEPADVNEPVTAKVALEPEIPTVPPVMFAEPVKG